MGPGAWRSFSCGTGGLSRWWNKMPRCVNRCMRWWTACRASAGAGTQRFGWCRGPRRRPALPTASLDFLVSDRVLFTPELLQVRREFARVLRPGSPVALVTDNRVYSGGSQAQEYDELLRAGCPGFREKRSPYDVRAAVASFFQGGSVYEDAFISEQVLTLDQLRAQTAALPIYPAQDATRMAQLDEALTSYFHRWALEDELTLPTICRVAVGCLAG